MSGHEQRNLALQPLPQQQQQGEERLQSQQQQQQQQQRGAPAAPRSLEQQLLFTALQHADPDALRRGDDVYGGKTAEEIEESRQWLLNALRDSSSAGVGLSQFGSRDIIDSMRISLNRLQQGQESFKARMAAMMEIDDCCAERMDFACDFERIGGLQIVLEIALAGGLQEQVGLLAVGLPAYLQSLTQDELAQLQIAALDVLGTCAQNNEYVQGKILAWNGGRAIEVLLQRIQDLQTGQTADFAKLNAELKRKYLLALSTLLSNNAHAVRFLTGLDSGLAQLVRMLQSTTTSDSMLQVKILFLVYQMLICEAQSNSTALLDKLQQLFHFHRTVFGVLQRGIEAEHLDLVEKCLYLLQEMLSSQLREPILQAITGEQLPRQSGYTLLKEKLLAQRPDEDDKYYDVHNMMEELPF